MIATCSHVGHVFRKSTPYSFPGGTSQIINHNTARLAEVWLDDWKEFYFKINPGLWVMEKSPACSFPLTILSFFYCTFTKYYSLIDFDVD